MASFVQAPSVPTCPPRPIKNLSTKTGVNPPYMAVIGVKRHPIMLSAKQQATIILGLYRSARYPAGIPATIPPQNMAENKKPWSLLSHRSGPWKTTLCRTEQYVQVGIKLPYIIGCLLISSQRARSTVIRIRRVGGHATTQSGFVDHTDHTHTERVPDEAIGHDG